MKVTSSALREPKREVSGVAVAVRRAEESERACARLVEAQEAVARRFAHELHDELGQTLTGIKLALDAAERGEVDASAALIQVRRLTEQAAGQVRAASLLLHPTMLEDLGLAGALRWLIGEHIARTRAEAVCEADLDDPLDDETSIQLFRIAQEALTNVQRHARARRVEVRLERRADEIFLRVADDGAGFAIGRNGGAGLAGMRARARMIGAKLTILSIPAGGTAVEVVAPLYPIK